MVESSRSPPRVPRPGNRVRGSAVAPLQSRRRPGTGGSPACRGSRPSRRRSLLASRHRESLVHRSARSRYANYPTHRQRDRWRTAERECSASPPFRESDRSGRSAILRTSRERFCPVSETTPERSRTASRTRPGSRQRDHARRSPRSRVRTRTGAQPCNESVAGSRPTSFFACESTSRRLPASSTPNPPPAKRRRRRTSSHGPSEGCGPNSSRAFRTSS